MESRSYVSQSTPCSTIKNIKKSHKKSAKEKLKRKNVHCPRKGEIKHENALSFDSPSPKHKSRAEVKRLSHGQRREKSFDYCFVFWLLKVLCNFLSLQGCKTVFMARKNFSMLPNAAEISTNKYFFDSQRRRINWRRFVALKVLALSSS